MQLAVKVICNFAVDQVKLALFPGLPVFGSALCAWNQKSDEKQGRPGNTHHVNDIWWMQGCRGSGAHL